MKYHKQLNRHDPANGVYGDCFRTALACLLDLDQPAALSNFAERSFKEGTDIVALANIELVPRGYYFFEMPLVGDLDQLLMNAERHFPDVRWLLTGMSRNQVNHVVVCHGGKIIHDPSQDESGIVGPTTDGNYWVGFVVPDTLVAVNDRLVGHFVAEKFFTEMDEEYDKKILLQAVSEFRQAFVVAVGDKSPFAKIALERLDGAVRGATAGAEIRTYYGGRGGGGKPHPTIQTMIADMNGEIEG